MAGSSIHASSDTTVTTDDGAWVKVTYDHSTCCGVAGQVVRKALVHTETSSYDKPVAPACINSLGAELGVVSIEVVSS